MFTINSKGNVVFWQPASIHDPEESDWSQEVLKAWYEDLATISHPSADVDRFTSGDKSLPIEAVVEKDDREKFKQACLDFAAACAE